MMLQGGLRRGGGPELDPRYHAPGLPRYLLRVKAVLDEGRPARGGGASSAAGSTSADANNGGGTGGQ
eukprot:1619114-Rhodomonas_salina.1